MKLHDPLADSEHLFARWTREVIALRAETAPGLVEFVIDHRLETLFWRFLQEQHLAAFACPLLLRESLPEGGPNSLLRKLKGYRRRMRDRSEQRGHTLRAISESFASRNCPFLLLKGDVLAHRLYDDPHRRHQSDIDLLVQPGDAELAVAVLQSLGCRLRGDRSRIRSATLRTQHAASLKGPAGDIDLHWRLRSLPGFRVDAARLWNDRMTVELFGAPFQTLADADHLLLLLLSLFSDLGRGGARLKHLVDVLLLLRQTDGALDWPRFWMLRHEEGTAAVCGRILSLAEEIAPEPLPGSVRAMAEQAYDWWPPAGETRRVAWPLVSNPRGSLQNAMWFARAAGLLNPPGLAWLLRRELPHLGRFPLLLARGARFLVRQLFAGRHVDALLQPAPAPIESAASGRRAA